MVFDAKVVERQLESIREEVSEMAKVPEKLPEFLPFGHYEIYKSIIESGRFLPIYSTGPTGFGKTLNSEQACAELRRECIVTPIVKGTDEDDLIGRFRMKDGTTYFDFGPFPVAMLRGAVLVMDEVDKADEKIMCVQRALEGKSILIKKLGVVIDPAPGFTVHATANTKGQGDESGKYITSQVLDESFLERFPITLEQPYPTVDEETKILIETFKAYGGNPNNTNRGFCNLLAKWARETREAAANDATDTIISLRRVVHILRIYHSLGSNDYKNQSVSVKLAISRYDISTQQTLRELYNRLGNQGAASNRGTAPPNFT